jgi:hypothetical protein
MLFLSARPLPQAANAHADVSAMHATPRQATPALSLA